MKKKFVDVLSLSVFLLAMAFSQPACADSPALEYLKTNLASVQQVLTDPKLAGDEHLFQRRKLVRAVLQQLFDFPGMSRRALGANARRYKDRLGEFTPLFIDFLEHSYMGILEKNGDAKIQYVREIPDGENLQISTKTRLRDGSDQGSDRLNIWSRHVAVGSISGRSTRPGCHRLPTAARQPARRPARAADVGVHPAGLRRRSRAALPVDLRDPGLHRSRRDVGQPHRRSGSRSSRPPTRCSRRAGAAAASWSTSTHGQRTAGRSSSTRRAPAATTRTSATRSCHGWTPATAPSPTAQSRAIMGKSAGGFGAMITPMLRPDLFGALATHAGDSLYELLLRARVRQGRAVSA